MIHNCNSIFLVLLFKFKIIYHEFYLHFIKIWIKNLALAYERVFEFIIYLLSTLILL